MGVFRNRVTGTRSLLCCFLLAVSARASEDTESRNDTPISFDAFFSPFTIEALLSQLPNPFICDTSSNFNVHGISFDGTLNLTDLTILGLDASKLSKAVSLDNRMSSQKVLIVNPTITFDEIHFVVGYQFSFSSASFPPLFASGNVRITFPDLILKLHYLARFQDIDDGFIDFRDFILWFSLGDHAKFHIDGLDSELSDLVNDVVTDCLSYLANKVNLHVDKHYRKISATLEKYLNQRSGAGVW